MTNNDAMIDLSSKRVTVTGGSGFLGQSVVEALQARNVKEIFIPRKWEYDLTNQQEAIRMYRHAKPDVVLHLAAEVGGIGANQSNPGRYFYSNMAMALNMIEGAREFGIEKFVQVGTICAYPKFTPVPFREDDIWNGYPEETNAPYGIAKKAAMVMLDGYRRQYGMSSSYVLPVNLYGPRDNFDLRTSHVIPALIRKCVEAMRLGFPSITCWGTGRVSREFLYVSDAAEGIVRAAERISDPTPINLGTNHEISIFDLTSMIARITGYHGNILWDTSKPDGQPRRCVDASRAKAMLDWTASTGLEDGIRQTVDWYFAHH
jgi:GDP-L-fucose synthase